MITLVDLFEMFSKALGVSSVELEGESPAHLRVEFTSEAICEEWWTAINGLLVGFKAERDQRTLVVWDE